ncbi:hypothetical protein [Leptotrichia wadei]|uniref:hypothetical protein n=1 Tax=Leptotrichia wadei TaxID=157687 RepID=UPI0028D0AD1F|nr:hypothetical protein [Leptotrichia wadei]
MIYSIELDSNLINNFQKVLKESGGDEANIVTKMLKNYIEIEENRKNKKILVDNMEFLDKKMDEHIDVLRRLRDK